MTTTNFQIGQKVYRVNSYYWKGMVYEIIDISETKYLTQIVGSKAKPKWINKNHFSTEIKNF